LFISAVFVILIAVICNAAPEEHLITNLPGLHNSSGLNFRQYAGYVTVEKTRRKRLFYWFVESQHDPAADPLVLHMNGGPGYSSLEALLGEHGPFHILENGELDLSPYSWNRIANVLYVETPCGVGFSKSDDPNDYYSDDQIAATDNYIFLKNWLELFPEFKKNDIILSSLSYGGHYIPTLAREILNNDTEGELKISGLLIGNPATQQDWYLPDEPGDNAWSYLLFFYTHGLLSHASYIDAYLKCDFGTYMTDCNANFQNKSDECKMAIINALKEIPTNIDPYDVDADVCLKNGSSYNAKITRSIRRSLMTDVVGLEEQHDYDPCMEKYLPIFLNRADVQSAIHAEPTDWKLFGTIRYGTLFDDMIPVWHEILNNPRTTPWHILIYSGDFDAVVPFLTTQRWIHCLGRPVKTPWQSWIINDQVGGSVIEYDRLSFLTVKGTGHDVAYYTPQKGFAFFQQWISKYFH